MKSMRWAVSAAVVVLGLSAGPAQSASWFELGAGDLLATAEAPALDPGTALDHLFGSLEVTIPVDSPFSLVHTDLYRIYVVDTADFSATTSNANTVDDTMLFLFDANGFGIFSNDDDTIGVQSTLPAGSLAGMAAGYYYVAAGITGTSPFGSGGSIFDASGGPASPGGGALEGWTPSTLSMSQAALLYEIDFTGVGAAGTTPPIPEPGSGLLMLAGLGGWAAWRARRVRPAPAA